MKLEKVFTNERTETLYQSIATAISDYYDGQLLECDIDCIAAQITANLLKTNGEYIDD